jgi:hypothetical protein
MALMVACMLYTFSEQESAYGLLLLMQAYQR